MEGQAKKTTGLEGGPPTVGAVCVVGGGIAGMQASLDLTAAGYKVYLVTESPALGGHMAQLDKTFPTNDCSTCMISPRLTAVGLDRNVEILTCSQVETVYGEAGNFLVTVRRKATYVDQSICNGCGACADVCPIERPNQFNTELNTRKAIHKLYPQAVPNKYVIEKRGTSPCKMTCPAHISVQGYVAHIAKGDFAMALEVIRERNPLVSVCGRVCHHPCESECARGKEEHSVAIRALKKFVTEWERKAVERGEIQIERVAPPADARRIAVVGGGPAGLAAMYELGRRGYRVTVFEQLPVAGGMLAVGIPEFRLPKAVLDHELRVLTRFGGEIRIGVRIGDDIKLKDLLNEYDAVFLSSGAQEPMPLLPEGEKWPNVEDTVKFLRDVRLGQRGGLQGNVLVVGGGNSAFDAARTSLRLGAKEVTILYRRTENEMPGLPEELHESIAEGVKVQYLVAPKRVIGENARKSAKALECIRMELGEPDESGRCRPIPVKGSEFTLPADLILSAIGQQRDLLICAELPELVERDRVWVNTATQETRVPRLFAGGDVTTQRAYTVVDAVAAAMRAAESIDRCLKGLPMMGGRLEDLLRPIVKKEVPNPDEEPAAPRTPSPHGPGAGRLTFDEVEGTFTEEQAKAEALRCLRCGICSECNACVQACELKAIDHWMQDSELTLEVGGVILAPGYKLFDPHTLGQYGYGRYPNVYVGLELERLLSASGPTMGHVTRRSDGKEPKRVAFIQCVGSRDERIGRSYCSSVCCMYATKQAIVAKEHLPGAEITIFYMDVRAFGKNFDRFVESAQKEHGIRYVRTAVSAVKQMQRTKDLRIRYRENGKMKEEDFDLVVLSTGLEPSPSAVELCERLGVTMNDYGFCKTESVTPLASSREGIYVCGVFQAPKDIPESVVQASGAAALCMQLLKDSRWTRTEKKEYPPERDITGEEPRVGVMVCHCGLNIGSIVDVPKLTGQAKNIPGVAHAEQYLFTCSQDAQQKIKEAIVEHRLNRLVVASCSPRTHEPLFREMMKEVGLNPYLFEMANIRDQCTWVHSRQRDKAQRKAASLIRMAVAKAVKLEPLTLTKMDVVPAALVIGGGLSGMTAAHTLAGQGHAVHLVERAQRLGGAALRLNRLLNGAQVRPVIEELERAVRDHPLITLHTGTEIMQVAGSTGNFRTKLSGPQGEAEIAHGVIVVATGAEESRPAEYHYGENSHVITQMEFEEAMARDARKAFARDARSVVMIQCVGSRCEERPYCSRVCCAQAVKNSLLLLDSNPRARVAILYRDMRTYGFLEIFYARARKRGVVFIRHDEDRKPRVTPVGEHFKVSVTDSLMNRDVTLDADWIVLSAAVTPRPEGALLSSVLKVPLTQDGFFHEAHPKLQPVDFASQGIYLCGMAHSPMLIDESIAQAQAAAARAGAMLARGTLDVGGQVAQVDPDKCAACFTCVRVCPYGVPAINEEHVAFIEAVSCQGCGTCVAQCPCKAIRLPGFTDLQLVSMCGEVCVPT